MNFNNSVFKDAVEFFFKSGAQLVAVNGKQPTWKDWQNSAATTLEDLVQKPTTGATGAALLCGSKSGIYCLDIDPRNDGFVGLQKLEEVCGPLPKTVTVETGGGGLHFYFRSSDPLKKRQSLFAGVDFQGESSLVVIPGSIHPSGKAYKFRDGLGLGQVAIAELPQALTNLVSNKSRVFGKSHTDLTNLGPISAGNRNSELFRIGLEQIRKDVDPSSLFTLLAESNQKYCDPPLSKTEVEKIAKSCLKYLKDFYSVKDGCLAKTGERLCNFDLRIIKEIIKDDGQAKVTCYELAGIYSNKEVIEPFVVSGSDFFNCEFIKLIGRKAIPVVGPFIREHIRSAIQELSENVKSETIYTHTGFRVIGGENVFLHSGGALGASGNNENIKVDLMMSQLSAYCLEHEGNQEQIKLSIRSMIETIKVAPEHVSIPSIAMNFRTPLASICPVPNVTFITGPTGSLKSTFLALKLSSFGRSFSHQRLPGNFESTANSIENIGFRLKDLPFGIDDLAPDGSLSDIQSKSKVAGKIIRGVSNGEGAGRNRMNKDNSLQIPNYFRGSIDMTAEDVVKGSSLRARLSILPLSHGDVDKSLLLKFQEMALNGVFVKCMSAYISWLCPQLENLRKVVPKRLVELRNQATQASGHMRTPEAIANMALGFELFLRFAIEKDAISADEATKLNAQAWNAFRVIDEIQKVYLTSEDPCLNFIGYLRAAMGMGKAHMKNYHNHMAAPFTYEAFGWSNDLTAGELRPKGVSIGWVDFPEGEIMFEPDSAYMVAQEIARAQGGSINLTRDTMWKRLAEGGYILKSESEGKNTLKRTPDGSDRSRFVIFKNFDLFMNTGMDSSEREQRERVLGKDKLEGPHAH